MDQFVVFHRDLVVRETGDEDELIFLRSVWADLEQCSLERVYCLRNAEEEIIGPERGTRSFGPPTKGSNSFFGAKPNRDIVYFCSERGDRLRRDRA